MNFIFKLKILYLIMSKLQLLFSLTERSDNLLQHWTSLRAKSEYEMNNISIRYAHKYRTEGNRYKLF